MGEADRGASLRETIEELKLELVRFVLFEVREGEIGKAEDRLAAPVYGAIEKAVQAVVDKSFEAGAKRIRDAAEALETAGNSAAGHAATIENRLEELLKQLDKAEQVVGRQVALAERLAAAGVITTATGADVQAKPRTEEDRRKSITDRAAETGRAPAAGETPTSSSPPPPRPAGPGLRERLAGWFTRGRLKLGAAAAATALLIALGVYYGPSLFTGSTPSGPPAAHSPAPAPNPFFSQTDLRQAALTIRSALDANGPLNPAGSERRQNLSNGLQLASSALAEMDEMFRRIPRPNVEQQRYVERLGGLKREVASLQATVTATGDSEKEPPAIDVKDLRDFADRLEQAANATPPAS
jgi:hypothetical protein